MRREAKTQIAAGASAGLLIAAENESFGIDIAGRIGRSQAAVCKPLTTFAVRAKSAPPIGIFLNPLHPHFRRFAAVPNPGVVAFPREIFSSLDESIQRACRGELTIVQAADLFERAVAAVIKCLPEEPVCDPRIKQVLRLLHRNADCSLSDIAEAVGVSYYRMSHLFHDSVGVPLRSYLLWQKVQKAMSIILLNRGECSLTEIARRLGFTDQAHLSRSFRKTYGIAPSEFNGRKGLRVLAALTS